VNGDGYADVIVGAYKYDSGETDEGAAFVFLGSATGVASGKPATAANTIQSDQASAQLGQSVAGAGDVNGDGYADVIVGANYYDAGQTNEGAVFVFLGSATGVANGTPATAAATLQSDQAYQYLGESVAGAGDVNGDGYADVIVGAFNYYGPERREGAAFVFLGGGGTTGRPTLARQRRGNGSGTPVQPWGGACGGGTVGLGMRGTDPWGRGRVKLEAEYCPAGFAFGAPQCGHYVSGIWQDVTATAGGVSMKEPILGLAASTLYHWRARVLHAPFGVIQPGITAPPNPAHGPWRRLLGQAVEADVRTGTASMAVEPPLQPGQLSITGIRPNPARGSFAVSFVLPGAGPAKLEVFDVAGRRVLARALRPMQTGQQTIVLGEGPTLPAGIYLVRLSQVGRAVHARVTLLQ